MLAMDYATCYLKTKKKPRGNILDAFMRRHLVMRHQGGLWNGIWVT